MFIFYQRHQFLLIISLIIFSLIINVSGNGRIEQKNIGIPDSDTSSSSSQQITQQNIGIPNDISGTDPHQSTSSSSSQFISQQNIGIPDDGGSGSSLGGGINSIPQQNSMMMIPFRSSSPTDGYIPQMNIGIPGSYGRAPSVMIMTHGRTGGTTGPIPLAVNSRHRVEYVDMPSTMTRISSSGVSPQIMTSVSGGMAMGGHPSTGYISQQNIGIPGNYGSSNRQVITLPVQSKHTVEYKEVPSTSNYKPISIEVPATRLGANINFHSSSNIKVSQSHKGSPGSYQETSSVDEPIRLSHTVRRPIIQELRETIQPYRKVVQQIEPVQQEIRTVIAVARKPGGPISSGSGTAFSSGSSKSHPSGGYINAMMPFVMPTSMYGGMMMNPGMMMYGTSGSSYGMSYGTTGLSGYNRNQGAKTKPHANNFSGTISMSSVGRQPMNSMQHSSSASSLAGTQQNQRKPYGQKGRRFYDGSYGIQQKKID